MAAKRDLIIRCNQATEDYLQELAVMAAAVGVELPDGQPARKINGHVMEFEYVAAVRAEWLRDALATIRAGMEAKKDASTGRKM